MPIIFENTDGKYSIKFFLKDINCDMPVGACIFYTIITSLV